MQESVNEFTIQLKTKRIKMLNHHFSHVISKFSILLINDDKNNSFYHINKARSKIITVDKTNKFGENYYIICIDEIIIIIITCFNLFLLKNFFNNNNKSFIYLVSKDIDQSFYSILEINDKLNNIYKLNDLFDFEINSFMNEFKIANRDVTFFFNCIKKSISGYLIQNCYLKSNFDRIQNYRELFESSKQYLLFNECEFIKLRQLGIGNSIAYLIYHIEKEELLVLKMFNTIDGDSLYKRERNNYYSIHHPFLPRLFGYSKLYGIDCLIIEYINGQTLGSISKMKLNFNEKMKIIFQIMIVFEYIHHYNFVYRDLKPNNIIINQNKTVVLIDFDRMIIKDENNIDDNSTNSFSSYYIAPEIHFAQKISIKADIYSLGILIYYIIFEKDLRIEYDSNYEYHFNELKKYPEIREICINSTRKDSSKRWSLSKIIESFYFSILSKTNDVYSDITSIFVTENISTETYFKILVFISEIDHDVSLYELGLTYFKGYDPICNYPTSYRFISKAALLNNLDAQLFLGDFFYNGIYIEKNIEIAINYYLKACKKYPNVYYKIGSIYLEGKYVEKDIDLAILFLSLLKNSNDLEALILLAIAYYQKNDFKIMKYYISLAESINYWQTQYFIGVLYFEGKYISQDITKSLQYFKSAANHYNSDSQYYLGLFYLDGKYVQKNINKAFKYLTLASNQNHSKALLKLGLLYYNNEYVSIDINKAIHYLSLSAKYNNQKAYYYLGVIFYEGKYVSKNYNLAIKYFESAGDIEPLGLYYLGIIYDEQKKTYHDYVKSTVFIDRAARMNCSQAQYYIGFQIYNNFFLQYKIDYAIKYFELAAKQNHPEAQFYLGYIYYEGKHVNKDMHKAINYFTLSANQNNSNAQYYLGDIYYKGIYVTQNINKAFHYLLLSAKQNNRSALFTLGFIYFDGVYVKYDINKVIYYYTLAADQGLVGAQNSLATLYLEGTCVKQNIDKAIHYYSLAARQNYGYAQYNLGNIYYEGKYVQRDINKAIKYFKQASNNNNANAQNILGIIYSEGKFVVVNLNLSFYYFSLAAKQNNPNAQYNLAYNYQNGIGVKKNLKKAFDYYSLASKQFHSSSLNNLSMFYLNGIETDIDIEKGIQLLSISANKNDEVAQYNLGLLYFEKKYVKQDMKKAIYYFEKSANNNYIPAQKRLATIYINEVAFKDIKRAIFYLEKIPDVDFLSQFILGSIYLKGKYLPKNIEKAIKCFKNSSSFNFQYSKNNLGIIYKKIPKYKNIQYSIVYFNEAIIQKNDSVSRYNLAHIYFYNDEINIDYNKIISLLIGICDNSMPSTFLLCFTLINILEKITYNDILQKLKSFETDEINIHEISSKLFYLIKTHKLDNETIYTIYKKSYKNIDFIYDLKMKPILADEILFFKMHDSKSIRENISDDFYKGFGYDIL